MCLYLLMFYKVTHLAYAYTDMMIADGHTNMYVYVCIHATCVYIHMYIDTMCGSLHHGSLAFMKETEWVHAIGAPAIRQQEHGNISK